MTCTKVGCQLQGDEEEILKSSIGGIVVFACAEHTGDLRKDERVRDLFRRQQKAARQLAILIDALKGPAADPQACLGKLDVVMKAEEELQDGIETWLNTTGSGLPS